MQSTATLERAVSSIPSTAEQNRSVTGVPPRIPVIDLLRGLVIVIMALDHVREFFTGAHFDPTDLTQTSVPLFLTRWITHFCAPVFVLLAGVSAWMAGRKRTSAQLSWLLLTRGLWLILLEFSVVNFGWYFNFKYQFGFAAQVIWAIGVSMIVLAGLVRLPLRIIAVVALVLIAGHNLLDPLDGRWGDSLWWAVLHVQRPFPQLHFFVVYPVLSWIGVMAAGYCLGPLLSRPPAERNRTLVFLGLGCCAVFVLVRMYGTYGDPSPFVPQRSTVFSVLSLLNTTKYPASFMYLLMTLGPAFLAIPALERMGRAPATFLATFGRAPLFFYVAHIYLVHLLAVLAGVLTGFSLTQMLVLFVGLPVEYGFSLPVVYLVWLVVLAALYRPTRWFGAMKAKRKEWWWAYL